MIKQFWSRFNLKAWKQLLTNLMSYNFQCTFALLVTLLPIMLRLLYVVTGKKSNDIRFDDINTFYDGQ